MNIKGITHLRQALSMIYNNAMRHRSRHFTAPNAFSHYLCTAEISGRVVFPIEYKFDIQIRASAVWGIDRVVAPIVKPNIMFTPTKRTADPLIKELFIQMDSMYPQLQGTVSAIKDSQGTIYYGGPGYALDSDLNPLIMFGEECDLSNSSNILNTPVCIINPDVFNREDILSKYIVKKIIPFMSDYYVSGTHYTSNRMKTIITNEIEKFVHRPYNLNSIVDIDNRLWNTIDNHKDEILEVLSNAIN